MTKVRGDFGKGGNWGRLMGLCLGATGGDQNRTYPHSFYQGRFTFERFSIPPLEPTPALQRAAEELQGDIQARYGFRPPLAVGQAPQGGIVIGTVESGLSPVGGPVAHDEGYTLEVAPTGISIVGTDERGVFYCAWLGRRERWWGGPSCGGLAGI